jgi:hypothetical protein
LKGGVRKGLPNRHFLKEGDRQNLWQSVKRHSQIEALLDDGDQHINRHRDPDLGFDGILGCAVETFDPKILFDPFEEKLH